MSAESARTWRIAVFGSLLFLAAGVSALAEKPRVGGQDELEIFDPQVNEAAAKAYLPQIEFDRDTPHGDVEVRIPPLVHVHRYYYISDKQYQAAFGLGGPVVIVANHPRTGKRMYIDVNLPQGAPVIQYDDDHITYVYPEVSVQISFSRHCPDCATVKYKRGKKILPRTENAKRPPSKLRQAVRDSFSNTAKTVLGAAGVAKEVAGSVLESVSGVTQNLPGIKPLRSAFEQRAERRRQNSLRAATRQANRAREEFVPTIR